MVAVTYNFDPERWYERERAALERRRSQGELDDDALAAALADLDRCHEALLDRLDGSYQIPASSPRRARGDG